MNYESLIECTYWTKNVLLDGITIVLPLEIIKNWPLSCPREPWPNKGEFIFKSPIHDMVGLWILSTRESDLPPYRCRRRLWSVHVMGSLRWFYKVWIYRCGLIFTFLLNLKWKIEDEIFYIQTKFIAFHHKPNKLDWIFP